METLIGSVLTQTNFKLDKWRRDLQTILPEIAFLKYNSSDFNNLSKRYNGGDLEPYLWNFILKNYTSCMSMGIRRMVDDHPQVISLWKLIDDIEANAEKVTSKWFLKEWPGGKNESLFVEFFDTKPSLQQTAVTKHKKQLEDITKSVAERADKFEAHKDKKPKLQSIPTYADIDKSVQIVTELFNKYYYLLNQSGHSF